MNPKNGMQPVSDAAVNGDRLWDDLMAMARIGATPKGGVNRQTLTDGDRQSRDLFVDWCRQAGCTMRIDRLGNIFARRAGRDDSLAPVLMGSHLDTQPSGGKFDGAYGVLAGLEVIRALNDAGVETARPIEAVSWTNEEGCRFVPAMAGSGAFAGVVALADVLECADRDGLVFDDELARIGYRGEEGPDPRHVAAYFELHIEQGPILEAQQRTIGVVRGAQAQRWFDVTLTGQESHAGTTPMITRRDALLGAARIVEAVNRTGFAHAPDGRATVGQFDVLPNSRNTIPGHILLTVDLRHPLEDALTAMIGEFEAAAQDICGDLDLDIEIRETARVAAVRFDDACVAAVATGADALDLSHIDMISGAGHDACNMALIAPTSMIFIPCKDGISHNEIESATPEDCAAGCDVLLRAVRELADRETS
jgi:beta-ureidopropionase / N-carbamoyl-L-amino-acid hydrolase